MILERMETRMILGLSGLLTQLNPLHPVKQEKRFNRASSSSEKDITPVPSAGATGLAG
jgi:hypothetical protein